MILYEQRQSIAFVTLNRPEKRNALSRAMIETLSETFRQIQSRDDLRAVILTGAGDRAFCAGTDISELVELTEDDARAASERGQLVCEQIESCPVPVIAAINGVASGGGLELALACHLRLASTKVQLSLPETKLGIIAGYGGTQRLAREIGRGRASEMMILGQVLSAEEALRLGLINRLTASENLQSEAESLAREIAELAPLAIRACLQAVNRGLNLPLEEGLALETELFASLFATDDMREGTRAFLEKRKPVLKGT